MIYFSMILYTIATACVVFFIRAIDIQATFASLTFIAIFILATIFASLFMMIHIRIRN